jgi:hypothetical protein
MDKQERTLIAVLGCIAFGLIFSLLYGIANELHDIRMELFNIKTKHHVIVEYQYKGIAKDTIVVYKERTIVKHMKAPLKEF